MAASHAEDTPEDLTQTIDLTIHHRGQPHHLTFPSTATLFDLSTSINTSLSIPPEYQKFLISPKPGLLKPPFTNNPLLLSTLTSRKITLLGSTPAEVSSLSASISTSQTPRPQSAIKPATPSRTRDFARLHAATTYTFHTLKPLPYLPHPERSLRFLERLRDDAGIKASMAKHKWSVPLLTEMNPAEHTTHESRTLGLNRNAGEVIELRLRTDAYDGYRDYKTIRRTLCHELTHNVWGEHDADFWRLCREVEAEVERGDWRSGGRALTEEEFYRSSCGGGEEEGEVVADHGGWTGGEHVLGMAKSDGPGVATAREPTSRREMLAKAAEERAKKKEGSDSK